MENLTHQPDMSVPNVESQLPGLNPTSIDFQGPWQPINGTNISQAGFEFDSEYKATGGLYVSGPGHPRPLVKSGISDITIGGGGRQGQPSLVETRISDPIDIHIPVLFDRKYGQGHTLSFLCY